jgi:zinc and cadmium transporter
MIVLTHIIVANLIAGLASVWLAARLSLGSMANFVKQLVSLSVGLLLATAIINIMPEAINSGANVDGLAWTFLLSLLFLIALEKLAVFRHTHHHEGDGHDHEHGHDHHQAGVGGVAILVGDSVHNFADGVMVAAAFMVDIRLGWVTAFSVAAHEIPQEIGDFIVLLNAGYSKSRALFFNLLSGVASLIGGVAGYFLLDSVNTLLPYILMITVASFMYVALADLIPSMQASRSWKDSASRFGLMALGVGVVCLIKLLH